MIPNLSWKITVGRRNFVLFYIFFSLLPICSFAQQKIGVSWEVPGSQDRAIQELKKYKKTGISALKIHTQPSKEVWRQIEKLHFAVYANLNIRFPTAETFSKPDTSYIKDLQQQAVVFSSQPSVRAIGLFDYPAWDNPSFQKAVKPFIESLKKDDKSLYCTSSSYSGAAKKMSIKTLYESHLTARNISKISVPDNNSIMAYQFSTSKKLWGSVYAFKKYLRALPQDSSKIIFVSHHWLQKSFKKHPSLAYTLPKLVHNTDQITSSKSPPAFPVSQPLTLTAIVLLVIWVSIAAHYNINPLYRKSLLRYFLSHKFFVKDIVLDYIRLSLSAFTIIIQHALLVSASTVSVFWAIFSPIGQKALRYHMHSFFFLNIPSISVFIWTLIFTILLSIISIIWLKMAYQNTESIAQIAVLYAWPLQLNLILCSATIILFASHVNSLITISFGLLSLFIFFCSFIASAMDMGSYLHAKKWGYWLSTVGIYVALTAGIAGWLASQTTLMEVIKLALHL